MEELLAMLDDKIFTPEVKDSIIAAFDDAVDQKVEIKVAEMAAENEDENGEPEADYEGDEEILNDMSKIDIVAQADEYVTEEVARQTKKLETDLEKHYGKQIKELANEATKYAEYIKGELIKESDLYAKYVEKETITETKAVMESKLNTYLDDIVDTMVNEMVTSQKTNVDASQLNALLEGFTAMLTTGGVYLKDINEASTKDVKPEVEAELEIKLTENANLKKELSQIKKANILAESVKNLTVPKQESVLKIAKHLKFISEADFSSKVNQIVSDVDVSGSTITAKPDAKIITEAAKPSVHTGKDIQDSHKAMF